MSSCFTEADVRAFQEAKHQRAFHWLARRTREVEMAARESSRGARSVHPEQLADRRTRQLQQRMWSSKEHFVQRKKSGDITYVRRPYPPFIVWIEIELETFHYVFVKRMRAYITGDPECE